MTTPLHVAAVTSLHAAAPARTEAAEDAYFRSHSGDLPQGVVRAVAYSPRW